MRSLKMNQTKKRTEFVLTEPDLHLPGWNKKQREDFFEAVGIHGLKKLKKLQRHIGTKTQEDVRIATELYKKEVRHRELTNDMERHIEEAGVTDEEYKTWLYFYMASQAHRGHQLPISALEAFLDQATPRLRPANQELTFPNWRSPEIKDFLATIELSEVITNVAKHIPTKNELEITGATDAYTIICEARNHAKKRGRHIPSYDDLRPGYIYLQCIVAALSNEEKLKKFEIPPNTDPDMARAQFVLKEWLMPDVGPLQKGWTKDEKYTLIVAIETFGPYDILRIQSTFFSGKTRTDLKAAIAAIRKEVQDKEGFYTKSRSERYMSLTSWGTTLTQCRECKHQIAAAKRLIFALGERPKPESKGFKDLFRADMTNEEMTTAMLNLFMQNVMTKGEELVPMLEAFIVDAQERQRQAQIQAELQAKTEALAKAKAETEAQAHARVHPTRKCRAAGLRRIKANAN